MEAIWSLDVTVASEGVLAIASKAVSGAGTGGWRLPPAMNQPMMPMSASNTAPADPLSIWCVRTNFNDKWDNFRTAHLFGLK